MASISDIKIDLINLITNISDYKSLESIYSVIQAELNKTVKTTTQVTKDVFELAKVDIRKGVSKDQIFAEQQKQPISFQEVQEIMTDEPWEQSLEELLETLD